MVEVNGLVNSVQRIPRGSELVAAATLAATTLLVDSVEDFDDAGGDLEINGVRYEYLSCDLDAASIVLATGLTEAGVVGDGVYVVQGGQVAVDHVAFVSTGEGDDAEVLIPFADRAMWSDGDYLDPVPVVLSGDLTELLDVPFRTPLIDGSYLDPDSTIPPAALTDGEPPTDPTTVVFIGGIGSLFFRWAEVVNADPVTYRLHVNAGSAPSTDGTYEVAAGVGLTSAAVRKLKDGTAIVPDGTVTYYGIVTVEDADGPGPASNTATGVPAQVTSADIAVNAITANLLTANDAFIDALEASDLTAITITGATVRTGASGERLVLRNDGAGGVLESFSGLTGESPGLYDPSVRLLNGRSRPAVSVSSGSTPTELRVPSLYLASGNNGTNVYDGSHASVFAGDVAVVANTSGGGGAGKVAVTALGADGSVELRASNVAQTQIAQLMLTRTGLTLSSLAGVAPLLDADMGAGSVGTGTFRDSVDARVEARCKVGEFNGSTNASAQVTITHGLGATPVSLSILGSETYGAARHRFTYDNLTSTTFRVTVRDSSGGLVSSPTRFMWQAWR